MGIVRDRFNKLVAVEYKFNTMNNVSDPADLDIDKGECALILNADVGTDGSVSRRDGYTLQYEGAYHSGWSSPTRDVAFYVKNGNITQFDGTTERTIVAVDPSVRCVFEEVNNVVVYSNGLVYGLIESGVSYSPSVPSEAFKVPVPSGQCLKFYNGRMYVAKDNILYCTDPFTVEWCDERDYVVSVFEDRITLVNKTDNGLLVATESEIFFLQGNDPVEGGFSFKELADYGAVFGTGVQVKDEIVKGAQGTGNGVIFCSKRGVCHISGSGTFTNLTQTYYTYPYGQEGCAIVRFKGGDIHYLANLDSTIEAFNQTDLPTFEVDSFEQ